MEREKEIVEVVEEVVVEVVEVENDNQRIQPEKLIDSHKRVVQEVLKNAEVVSKSRYDELLLEGGNLLITKDGVTYRFDSNANTFEGSLNKVSTLLGIPVYQLEQVILSQETITIGEYEYKHREMGSTEPSNLTRQERERLVEEKKTNNVNYTIFNNTNFLGKISLHDSGHFTMANDANARKPHINFKIEIGDKEINGHIYYTK